MPTRTTAKTSDKAAAPGASRNTTARHAETRHAEPRHTAKRATTGARKSSHKNGSAAPANAVRKDLDYDHFRTLLLAERARLEAELEQIRNRSTDMESALPEEGEGDNEDTADLASAMMDKEMDLSVEDEIEDMLAQVNRGMEKLEDGSYGVCDMSGEPIPVSRLELIPWASLTVECQALAEGD